MRQTAFVSGADRGLGFAFCLELLTRGWQVFAGQYMPDWPDLSQLLTQHPQQLHIIPLDISSVESAQAAALAVENTANHLDLLVNNAGKLSPTQQRGIRNRQDYDEMHHIYDVNTLGALRVVEAFLPLMEKGGMRRMCFVSSEAGSITRAKRKAWFSYCMSKAALNMAVKILFNDLRADGYTFRVYHPGWVRTYMYGHLDMSAKLGVEEAAARAIPIFLDPRENEDRLVLIDHENKEWPW